MAHLVVGNENEFDLKRVVLVILAPQLQPPRAARANRIHCGRNASGFVERVNYDCNIASGDEFVLVRTRVIWYHNRWPWPAARPAKMHHDHRRD
jgi:hypothetical protein